MSRSCIMLFTKTLICSRYFASISIAGCFKSHNSHITDHTTSFSHFIIFCCIVKTQENFFILTAELFCCCFVSLADFHSVALTDSFCSYFSCALSTHNFFLPSKSDDWRFKYIHFTQKNPILNANIKPPLRFYLKMDLFFSKYIFIIWLSSHENDDDK